MVPPPVEANRPGSLPRPIPWYDAAPMKLRTIVLVSALLIVPLAAMFSHMVPADLKRMLRAGVWQQRSAMAPADARTDGTIEPFAASGFDTIAANPPPRALEPITDQPAPGAMPVPERGAPDAQANLPLEATGLPPDTGPTAIATAAFGVPQALPARQPALPAEPLDRTSSTVAPPRQPASPQAVADALAASTRGDWTSHVRRDSVAVSAAGGPGVADGTASKGPSAGVPATAFDPTAVERQLAQLGAIGFEFLPADAGNPRHRCSCRLPVDPSGQLQRVFQADDDVADAAVQRLLAEVTAWQRRAVARVPSTISPVAGDDGLRR